MRRALTVAAVWNLAARTSRATRRPAAWVCVRRSATGRADVELCAVYAGVVGDGCPSSPDPVVSRGAEGHTVSREARATRVPVLHENRGLQVRHNVQIPPPEGSSDAFADVPFEPHRPSSAPCKWRELALACLQGECCCCCSTVDCDDALPACMHALVKKKCCCWGCGSLTVVGWVGGLRLIAGSSSLLILHTVRDMQIRTDVQIRSPISRRLNL